MKYCIAFFVILLSFTSFGQNRIFYIAENNAYSVLVNKNSEITKRPIEGGEVTYLVMNDSKGLFKYYFSISQIQSSKDLNIKSDKFLESFKNECQCEVLNSKNVSYNNVEGVEIFMSAVKDESKLRGYSFATVSNNLLFSITFLTLAENLDKNTPFYNDFINSFVINR